MGQNTKTPARPEPVLPGHAPQVLLTAVTEQVTVSAKLTKPVTLIGSRRDCDLSIGHSDVAKVHCALVNTGTEIIVTDLCTRSGTFVNGRPISLARLRPGDEFQVGSEPVGVWFSRQADDSAPPPADEHEDDFELRPPLRLTGAERSYVLTTLPAVIGRRSACPVVLDTPDVSLTHALLFLIEGRPAVFDLGSRSGTYLNGQRVGLAWLADGDELSIGGERLSLTFDGREQAPPTAAAAADLTASAAEADLTASATEADDGVVDIPQNTVGLPGPGRERLDARPSSARAPTRGELAALGQREAALDEREARLAAAECELARRQAELAERERANAEAAAQVAASLDELRETCRALGLARALAAQPADPNPRPAAAARPNGGLGDPVSEDAKARIGWQHVADAADRPGFAPGPRLD